MKKPRTEELPFRDSPWARVLAAAALLGVTLIVYLPVIRAGYIWDDDTALTENPAVRSLSGLWTIWCTTKQFDYFPLTFTSFWLEWRLWGMNPVGYHTVNVLLHSLGAILFWRVLLRLKIPGAWLAALLFALHPVCVASVAWVAERKNTLSLVFYFLSLLWFLRSEDESRSKTHLWSRYYVLSLVAFLLALFSKTSVVTLPFVMWMCLWWRSSRLGEPSPSVEPGNIPAQFLSDLKKLAPFFALALVLGLVTVWFQSHRAMSGNVYQRDALPVRLLGGSWAAWFYLGKALLPVKLSMIYPRWDIQPGSLVTYVPGALALGTILVCLRFRRAWGGPFLFALVCFGASLLPVLGFFDMSFFVYSRVADHLQYLAIPPVVALVVGLICSKLKDQSSYAVIGLVAIFLGLLSWDRARVFKGQETLWRDTLAKNPKAWPAWNNLGMATKNPAEEFNCYFTALQLNPNYSDAHNNMGVILFQGGKVAEAIDHFQQAIRLQPRSAQSHNNLGGVLLSQGKVSEAYTLIETAVRLNPHYLDARNNFGSALLRLGRTNEAAQQFEMALRIQPRNPDAHWHLAVIASQNGMPEAAINHYRAMLEVRPESYEAHHNLGIALVAANRLDEALAEFNAVLQLKPGFAPPQYQIAEILLKQGKRTEAIQWFTAAVKSLPGSPEAHHRLGTVLLDAGQPEAALPHLREAVKLKPQWVRALADLAWFCATQPDPKLRNGDEAIKMARQAGQLTGGTNAIVLDTLAAAHAETGNYSEATMVARQALVLARNDAADYRDVIEARLALYEREKPFRGRRMDKP